MRTMSSVWFTVIMLIGVQKVFSNICYEKPQSCDECIRCKGSWCSEPGNPRCSLTAGQDWCPNHRERVFKSPVSKPGDLISQPGDPIIPISAERFVLVGETSTINLYYMSNTSLKVNIDFINTCKGNKDIIVKDEDHKCSENNCTVTIKAQPLSSFCSNSWPSQDFITAQISIGNLSKPAKIKYHVACRCECSAHVVSKSEYCSGHGNYSCGICSCERGWKGTKCDLEDCPERGDNTQTCQSSINDLDCSGNGWCDHCNICNCNMNLEGSQYFELDYCTDLCMTVNECSDCTDCIFNSTTSDCYDVALSGNRNNMIIQSKNESLLDERDDLNRKKWVKCNVTVRECTFNYMAKRDADGEVYVTVIDSCNDIVAGAYTPAPTASIVMGILGILAVVGVVAGVMIWKHVNAIPPVPMNGAGYTDIDAEDCVGENPLYKPPTSSFKNPTYGKW